MREMKSVKKLLLVFTAVLALCLGLFAAACGETIYRIAFVANGRDISVDTLPAGAEIAFPDEPTKAEDDDYTYTFEGWDLYEEKVVYGDEPYEPDYRTGDALSVEGALSLYAVFRATPKEKPVVTYTVIFLDGITGEQIGEEQHVPAGGDATLPAPPVHKGYAFKEWNKSHLGITARTEITAVYVPVQHELTLHYLGNEVTSTVDFAEAVAPDAPASVPAVLLFEGWFTDEGCTQPLAEDATMPDADLDLYAKYEIDLSGARLQLTGDHIYGTDAEGREDDLVHVTGLPEAEGLAFTFSWQNAEGETTGLVKKAGETEVTCAITANYKNVLTQTRTLTLPVTLEKATLTAEVTLAAQSGVYGTQPAPSAVLSGLSYGDETPDFTIVVKDSEGHTAEGRLSVGTYTVALEAGEWENYKLGAVQTATYTVTPATVRVTAKVEGALVYGDTPVPALSYEGLVEAADAQAFSVQTSIKNVANEEVTEHFSAGSYTVAAVGGEFGRNYTASYEPATSFSIAKKALVIGVKFAGETSFEYGAFEAPVPEGQGFIEGEGLSALGGAPTLTYSREGQSYSSDRFHAGNYTVSVSGYISQNYEIEYAAPVAFTVTPKTVTAHIAAEDIVYGETPSPELTFEGFLAGEDETALSVAGERLLFTKEGKPFEGKFTVGEYTVTSGEFTAADYTVTPAEAHFEVTRAALTATVTAGKSVYTYGETPTASVSFEGFVHGESEDVLPGEQLAIVWTKTGGEAAGFHVGEYTATIALKETENYTVSVTAGSCKVEARALQLTAASDKPSYTYGEEVSLSYKAEGFAEGENEDTVFAQKPTYKYTKDEAAYTPAGLLDAGSYTVELTYASENGDYTVSAAVARFTVAKKTFSIAKTQTHPRDGEAWSFAPAMEDERFRFVGTLQLAGNDARDYTAAGETLGDDFTWKEGSWKIVLANGEKDVSANFTLTFDLHITVSGSGFGITLPTGTSFVYDGNEHTFPVQATANTHDEVEISVEYSETGTDGWSAVVPAYTNAGEYTVYYKVSAPNYETQQGSFTVNISKAEYTVKTDDTAYTYDGTAHGDKPTVSGVKGEDLSAQLQALTYSFTEAGEHEVSYTVNGSGNYNEKTATYTVHIAKAKYTVSTAENSFTYNGTAQGEGVLVQTVHEGDLFTVTYGGAGVAPTFTDAGTHAVEYRVSGNANYKDAEGSYNVVIAAADFTVEAEENSYTYNGTAQGKGVRVSTVHEGDPFTVTYEGEETAPTFTAAGEHVVRYTVSGKNYNDKTGSYTVSIAKATLTASVSDVSATYNGENHFKTVGKEDIEGLFSEDAFTVKYGTADGLIAESGLSLVNVAQSGTVYFTVSAENYEPFTGSYTVNIAKADYKVQTDSAAYTYDGTAHGAKPVVTGANGEDLSEYLFVEVYSFTEAGEHPVTYTVGGNGNYNDISDGSYSVNIEKASFTVQGLAAEALISDPEKITYTCTLDGVIEADVEAMMSQLQSAIVLKEEAPIIGGVYFVHVTIGNEFANYTTQGDAEQTIVLKLKSVKIGETFYTIEEALKAAQSGNTITVAGDTAFATKDVASKVGYVGSEYYTIKQGVTLFLPYNTAKNAERGVGTADGISETVSGLNGTTQTDKYRSARGNRDLCDLTVTVPEGIELFNEGTLNIGGITSGGGGNASPSVIASAGQTSSGYARLVLGKDVKLTSTGTITSFGFIEESEKNNGSQILLNGGSLSMPFVVREHRGGGAFTTMVGGAVAALNPNAANNLKTSPFNRFYMENIHPQLIATSSAKLFGRANLYANDTDNQTDIAMAGSESGCLLQLKNGAKLFAKFDIETAVTSLEIKGDMTVNALSLKLECGSKFGVTLNATLHTKAVFFPISWYYNITLSAFEDGSPATVDATAQKLKVMPGASLTVGKNVTLNASEVVVYDEDAIQDINDSSGAYEKKSEPSLLIINGTMTVKNLAGKVRTEMEGAKLSITDSATIATKEVSSHSGSGLSATVNYKDITTNLQLKMYAEGVVADFTQQGIGTYTSIGGGWQKQEA